MPGLARPGPAAGPDLHALAAITDAVEGGLGLPEVVRAAAKALDSTLVLQDRSGSVLAVAARSPADERAVLADGPRVSVVELKVGPEGVGRLRLRPRSTEAGGPDPTFLKLATTLIAAEVERLRAPERASEAAQEALLQAILDRDGQLGREDLVARGSELGVDLDGGGSVLVARAHRYAPSDGDWRARFLQVIERAARTTAANGALAARLTARETDGIALVALLVAGVDPAATRRVTDGVARELTASMPGTRMAVGSSRPCPEPVDLHRAGNEALLAANVAETGNEDDRAVILAFEDTGAYRLLLPAMAEDPQELQRFYAETVEPLVAYDEQYDTDLVQTLETFLDADGNVAGTAQRLFTHRHTVRYRLERVRELSGLDVGSTDGREKLGLGLKAMRVLGIAATRGPADEAGTQAGRVPGRERD